MSDAVHFLQRSHFCGLHNGNFSCKCSFYSTIFCLTFFLDSFLLSLTILIRFNTFIKKKIFTIFFVLLTAFGAKVRKSANQSKKKTLLKVLSSEMDRVEIRLIR
jgi:hypothetical protein